jgi:hypothetical protein
MTQIIVFKTSNGLVSLLYAATGVSISEAAIDVPADATATWMGDDTELPAKFRGFPQALAFGKAKAPTIDMAKAREIFKDKIREARAPLFQEHDVKFMLALEKGESTDAAVAAKQKLRDLTDSEAIDNAKNLTSLVAAWPIDALGVDHPFGELSNG